MEAYGRIYADGKGVAKNYSVAIIWFERAIEKGNRGALVALGSMYDIGKSVPKDKERTNEFYRRAASLGDYSANQILKDTPLGEQGDAEAQNRIGELWLFGRGVVEDIDEGLRFLEGPRIKATFERFDSSVTCTRKVGGCPRTSSLPINGTTSQLRLEMRSLDLSARRSQGS